MNQDTQAKADAAFRKQQKAADASAAWQEYEANQAAVNANMKRLRALRLAREAATLVIKEKGRKKKAA
jgi:hypothetical protein